jgi:HSP20 family molecular chaperone IbpA
VVVIRGKRPEEDFSEGQCTGAFQLEIYYGDFEREIKLPDVDIHAQEIRAAYRNGFLIVTLPKRVRITAPRNVAIESF